MVKNTEAITRTCVWIWMKHMEINQLKNTTEEDKNNRHTPALMQSGNSLHSHDEEFSKQVSEYCSLPCSCADAQGRLSCHKPPERSWSRCHIPTYIKYPQSGEVFSFRTTPQPPPTSLTPWNPQAPPVPGLPRPVKKTTTLWNPETLQADSTSKYP